MARLPLLGGAYLARSVIANAQRRINYFPEMNTKDAPVPVTHYQRPGLRPLVQAPNHEPVRGLFRSSNGNGYAVIGATVYKVGADWSLTQLGSLSAGRTNPVSFVDNGAEGVFVDGSNSGWQINIGSTDATQDFTQIVDPTGAFTGADKVDFLDTFILFNYSGTSSFGSTHSGGLALIAAPDAPQLSTSATGGALASGTYYARLTYVNSTGETTASVESHVAVVGPSGSLTVVAPKQVFNVTGYNVYVGLGSGQETLQNGAPVDIGVNFTLTSLSSAGVGPPRTNTSGGLIFDPLYIAAKIDWPDPIKTLIVNRHEILLLGDLKSEVWFNAGNPLFPFAELPGSMIEHGIASRYSVASSDISVFWLGHDLQGDGVVFRHRGYITDRISNHALEVAIQRMKAANGGQIGDVYAYCYQLHGHVFYVMNFVQGDQTWAFDDSIGEWSQRAWTDPQTGQMHRDRSNSHHAFINETNVVGDYQNGTLYALDPDTYTDTVAGVSSPIVCVASFPHISTAELMMGMPQPEYGWRHDTDGRRIKIDRFLLDMECGAGPGQLDDLPNQVSLRISRDRGKTFSSALLQSAGIEGEYEIFPQWLNVGVARDFVFEISHSIAGPAALNGAWVKAQVLET